MTPFSPATWVWLTITAALLQSVRTGAQKQLTAHLTVLAGTYVRALLGLPVMIVYLLAIQAALDAPWPRWSASFFIYALITALTQLAATAALLSLYALRSFAVANQLGKSDMIFTALLGSAFFGQSLSAVTWLSLTITAAGLIVIMTARSGIRPAGDWVWHAGLTEPSVLIGLFVGVMFGFCNLALREATLSLHATSPFTSGAVTVAVVAAMQVAIMGAWLHYREPGANHAITRVLPLSTLVGITSGLGSICWFTAFAMTSAANVRVVGQIEVIFTLLIGAFYFRERITPTEAFGMGLTIVGILALQALS